MSDQLDAISVKGKVFKELKKSLANMDPKFVMRRYSEYNPNRVMLYDVFEGDFDKSKNAESLHKIAQKLQYEPEINSSTYEEDVRRYYEAVVTFLEKLPEAEIKRAQNAYRQRNYKRNKRHSYSENRPYKGECDRDFQIQRLAEHWGVSKKSAIEKAVDMAISTITGQSG